MKKYGKLIAFTVLAYFISAAPAFAKSFTLEEFGKKVEAMKEKEDKYAAYVYVIGDYAFTSAHTLTVQDIMLAARSIKLEDGKTVETDESEDFGKMAIQYIQNAGTEWKVGNPQIGDKTLTGAKEEKFNVVYIDYKLVAENYIEDDVDPAVDAAVADLNKDAAKNGFNEVTFTEEKAGETVQKTITFAVHDLNRKVSTYAQTAASMFDQVLNKSGLELKEIKYTLSNEEKKVSKADIANTSEIIKLAKALIGSMTGKSDSELTNVTYADLIGKSAHATFVFEVDGHEYQEDYYVTFTYDFEEDKDVDLTAAAKTLDKAVKEHKEYGFREVTYDEETNTAEFAIQDDSVKLSAFASSGIVDMFTKYITGATKVEYTYGNTKKEITFDTNGNQPNATNAVKWAKELLCLMASKDSDKTTENDNADSCDATKLILADVAGKEATAKITYQLNDGETKEITYTLRFTYDLEDVKNYELTESASELDKEVKSDGAKEKDYGFSSVTYDEATKTIEFEVSNEGSKLVNFATSGIMEMFVKFADNAKEAEYTIGDQKYTETINDETLSGTDVKKFAARLLMRMAGQEVGEDDSDLASKASQLTVGQVAGKSASATFTFVVDGKETKVTYTVKFNYEVEEVKNAELTTFAEALNATLSKEEEKQYGFDSITFKDNKVTFTIASDGDEKELKTFVSSGIVDMFLTFITNATQVEYTVNDETTKYTVNLTDNSQELNVINLAAELLVRMAGKDKDAAATTASDGSDESQKSAELLKKAMELKVKDVSGKKAKATFTYKVDDEEIKVTYDLEFAPATEAKPAE